MDELISGGWWMQGEDVYVEASIPDRDFVYHLAWANDRLLLRTLFIYNGDWQTESTLLPSAGIIYF
jgi:hypothetical protein